MTRTKPLMRMPTLSAICTLTFFALLTATSASAQPVLRFVDPTTTGPGITPLLELPGAANRDLRHLVGVDPAQQCKNGVTYSRVAIGRILAGLAEHCRGLFDAS